MVCREGEDFAEASESELVDASTFSSSVASAVFMVLVAFSLRFETVSSCEKFLMDLASAVGAVPVSFPEEDGFLDIGRCAKGDLT